MNSAANEDIVDRMNQRLERMLERSRQARRQREQIKMMERQVRLLAEKLGVELI